MSNYTKKAVIGAGTVAAMMYFSYFLGYVLRVAIARFGGPTSLGLVYSVISLFGMFSLAMNFGLRAALLKYIPEFLATKKLGEIKGAIIFVMASTFILSAIVCGALMVFADQVAYLAFPRNVPNPVDISYAALLIRVYGIGVIFSSIIMVLKNCFNGFQEVRYFSSIEVVKSVISTALTIILLFMGMNEVAPLLGFTLTYVVFLPAIYAYLFIRKVFPEFFSIRTVLNKALAVKLAGFGLNTTLIDVAGTVSGNIDTMVLTFYQGTFQSGLYNAAQPMTKLLTFVGPAITAIVFPMSSELWVTGKKEKLSRGLSMLYKYLLISIFPVALIMLLFPDVILRTLFGKEFGEAGLVLGILTVGYVFQSFTWANSSALSGIGKPKDAGMIALAGSGVLLVLDFALVPSYGMTGAGYANLAAFLTTFLLSTQRIKTYVPVHIPWKDFFSVGVAGAVITGLSYSLIPFLGIWPRIFFTVAAGSLIYVGILFSTKSLVMEDIRHIVNRVK